MVCFNKKHYQEFDPSCNPCQNELRDYVKEGRITELDYKMWMDGLTPIGMAKIKKMVNK